MSSRSNLFERGSWNLIKLLKNNHINMNLSLQEVERPQLGPSVHKFGYSLFNQIKKNTCQI